MEKRKKLAGSAGKKDADAFAELMQRYMQDMYKISRAILDSDEDAADAISDTILDCWEKLHQLKEENYFKTWMVRILINNCKEILRKRKRVIFMDQIPEISYSDEAYQNLEWKEALEVLDEKYRLVVLLYYVEGFKTSEISSLLDIPESTVRTRLSRAREKMYDIYGKEEKRRGKA